MATTALPARLAHLLLGLSATLALFLAASCSGLPDPVLEEERPAGSGTWVVVEALPTWIDAPPQAESALRFVHRGRSNVRNIVVQHGGPLDARLLRRRVSEALSPLIGDELAREIATDLPDNAVLLERASRDELLTRKMVPGNTLSTVWALWEIPMDRVTERVRDEKRADVRAALRAANLDFEPDHR